MNKPLTIQYLGQAGFLFSDASTTAVIDPYLSYSVDRLVGFPDGFWVRSYPPPVLPAELRNLDLVLTTHDHLDHADPETLIKLANTAPQCVFAGPRQTVALMQLIGIAPNRTVVLNAGAVFVWNNITIEPTPAAHEVDEVDADGYHRYLGYLLRWNGRTLYHAGDTLATAELSAHLACEHIDVGFLPVNGSDEARRKLGIVGNMNVAAAAALAARHHFHLLVPMHYDLYPCNGLSATQFAIEWISQPEAKCIPLKVFSPGERLVLD